MNLLDLKAAFRHPGVAPVTVVPVRAGRTRHVFPRLVYAGTLEEALAEKESLPRVEEVHVNLQPLIVAGEGPVTLDVVTEGLAATLAHYLLDLAVVRPLDKDVFLCLQREDLHLDLSKGGWSLTLNVGAARLPARTR